MATKRFTPKIKHDEGKHLALQSFLIRKHFPCFTCSLRHRVLECEGRITPCEECQPYRIRIRLSLGGIPSVRVLDPPIMPHGKIHMYSNGDLCLYDHRDQPWKATDNLHQKIVPWIAEWLVFYELFLITGEWQGPEALHANTLKSKQSN